jgi:hypothetical protein
MDNPTHLQFTPTPTACTGCLVLLPTSWKQPGSQRPSMHAPGSSLAHSAPLCPPPAVQILSWFPRVVLYPNFMTGQECDEVIQTGKDRLYQSGVALRAGETYNNQIRTSQGTFMSSGGKDDNVLGRVERRAAEATMLPWSLGEVGRRGRTTWH